VIENIKDLPAGCWIPQVNASEYREGEAFVVVNDYRRDNWEPYIFHTTDFGKKWKNIVSADQVTGYALSFVQDQEVENLYFAGTESGLYISIDAGSHWTKWTHKYPTVSTMDLKIHPRENDLIIGTFGRAAYIIDNIQPLRELAKKGLSLFEKPAHSFPIPEAEMAVFSQPPGYHFPADAAFAGENKEEGAMISYIANPAENSKEKVVIEIFDKENNLLYSVKNKAEKGINRAYWRFNKKSVRFPNRPKPKNEDDPSYGGTILPGTYKVKLSYNGQSDSSLVNVIFDHRIKFDMASMIERDQLNTAYEAEVQKATNAADKIRDAQAILKQTSTVINELKGDEFKDLKELHNTLDKKLAAFVEILDPKPVQGIYRNPELMPNILRQASRAIGMYIDKPGLREKIAIDKARNSINKFVTDVNKFFTEDWTNYQKLITEKKINYFTNFK